RFSQQLLELVVLLLQFLQALGVRDGHTAELRLPVVVGGLRDPVLAAQFGHLGPCLGLLQHPGDLFFRKSFLHCRSFVNGLYIDFVLTTGSRSNGLYIDFVLTTGSRSQCPAGCGVFIVILRVSKTKPQHVVCAGVLRDKSLTMTYFHRREVHYHRREGVSLYCSGWEGVGPPCYGRQA